MAVASPETYLADLNPAQREAVLHTEGPLLVVAGAGSGKTRVLTHRVAHLISAVGVEPNEILAITFTNKAAGEMRSRLEDLLPEVARRIWILTFHAACGRILRREAPRLGYRTNFTIYDQADQVRLVEAMPGGARARSEALPGQGHPRPHLVGEEPADQPGRVPEPRRLLLRPDRRGGLRPLPAAAVRGQRRRLRRPPDADRRRPRAVPGGEGALAEGVPLHPRRRVPGHEPRAVPAAPALGREAQERLRRRRSGPVDLRIPRRRHPQHPRVRAGLRRDDDGSRSSRTTARRTRSSARRTP